MKLRLRQPLALLLTIAMLLGLLPTVAFATEGSTETKNPYAHENHNGDYTAWNDTNALPSGEGTYYLSKDITLSENWDVPGETILCLNGHNINLNTYRLEVGKDEHLVICDCSTTEHQGFLNPKRYYLWTPGTGEGEVCNLIGGVIYGGVSTEDSTGSCINAAEGDVTIAGGNIAGNLNWKDNRTNSEGTVRIRSGNFTMYGGSITGNYAYHYGGGIYVSGTSRLGSKVSLYGGEICHNTSEYGGGGVYTSPYVDFLLDGGSIEYNKTGFGRYDSYGGGVTVSGVVGDAVEIKSGSICYNACNGMGGGIYLSGSGYVDSDFFTMTGGLIQGNYASRYGGGIGISRGAAEITGGTITGNTAEDFGGGIRAGSSSLTIGTKVNFSGNTSQTAGSDLAFINSATSSAMLSLEKPKSDGDAKRFWFDDTPELRYEGNESRVEKHEGNINSKESEYLIAATGIPAYTVTVEDSYAATTGEGKYAAGDTVTIDAGSPDELTFNGWTVTPESVKLTNADSATTTFTMPAGNVTVTANWASNEKIQVIPADIIIYMGGKPYEGAVDGSGTIITNQNAGLPEPGFRVTLPDALKDKGITSLTFKEKDGDRTWTFQPYDDQPDTDVYKLVPADGQAATRVQFTKADGTVIPSDEFEVGREVNTSFQMGLYKGSGETEVGEIVVIENGVEYAVDSSATGTLTVRGTTGDVSITSVSENAPTDGKPGAVAAANTTYTINKGNVQVDNDANVSLLFDGIINNEGNDRTGQLEQRAAKALAEENIAPAANHHFVYELKYLDLVDANNGNAWVKASDDLTIYWPLPEGADTNTLKVLHFKDLHRDMVTDQIEDEIAKCDVEIIPSTVSGNHVTFEIGSGGFSPFTLVWEEDTPASSFTIEATVSGSGSINPGGTINVAAGSNQTITFTPDSGYYVSSVVVDGQSVSWTGNSYTFTNVTANHTIIVTFAKSGGGSGTTYYIIDAEAGQGGEISPDGRVRVARGSDKTFTITPDEGYRIADVLVDGRSIGVVSRYTFENVRSNHTIKVFFEKYSSVADPDDTGVSEWLDTSDHRDFLHGYTDGTFGPNRNMTRGEVAQMFYNLLLEQDVPQTTAFTDVPADMWCADAVNTLASLGIVEGIGNGLYAPDRAITRAEFTVIAMRFAELDTSGENIFSDVDTGDWFYEQVVGSIKYGWIQGYADGTFRPDNTITRAEVTTITNRMLGRAADEAFVDRHSDELRQFPDVPESYWAYYNIVEATNAHDFSMENGAENWSGLN